MKRIWIPQVIGIAMLLWALNPANPYAYYILLRWICCAIFACLAVQALRKKQSGWAWVLGVTAAIYNPFIPLHLNREIWTFVNIVTIAVALGSIFFLKMAPAGETVRRHRFADEQGHADAQINRGVLHALGGQGVPKDDAEAARWYRKAAEQNYAEAQLALGTMYGSGRGVPQDRSEAIRWWRKAAGQGHAEALSNLAFMYAHLHRADVDPEAVCWFTKAAEQNDADIQHNLGLMYAEGSGVPQNPVLAYKWLNIAAITSGAARSDRDRLQHDMTPEQIKEAQRLSEDHSGVKDDAEAVRLYSHAAKQGDPDAQFNLGVMYEKGRGVPKDEAEAVRCWRRAAEQGHAEAQYNLACINHANGNEVPKDAIEAVKWFRRAAEQNHPRAQFRLGRIYAEGFDVPRNPVLAHKWLNLAAASFSRRAEIGWIESTRSALDSLQYEMTPEQIAEAGHLRRDWMKARNL